MNEKIRDTKEEFYMKIAEVIKTRSTCERLQVGALVVNDAMTQILSMGYNGNYAGGPNVCDSDEPGNCGCVHAEANALIKPRSSDATVMFITDSPCLRCAKLIINSGIRHVYYRNEYRVTDGLDLLKKNYINVVKV